MKTEIKYGIIAGVGVSLSVLLEYFIGLHSSRSEFGKYSVYLSAIIPIVTLFFAIKRKRDIDLKGKMTFLQGFKTGSVVSLISSLITTFYLWTYNHYINPDFIHNSMIEEKRTLINEGVSDMLIQRKMEEFNQMNSDYSLFTSKLFILVILGTAISAILSAALRNYRKPRKSNEYLERKF